VWAKSLEPEWEAFAMEVEGTFGGTVRVAKVREKYL